MTRVVWLLVAVLVVTACHSIDRGVFAQGPVPLDVLPLREPITYTVGPNAGQVVPAQHGLLASYFSGAAYVQPAYGEVLDHQQIDPNVNFVWDGSDTNPVIPVGGIDFGEGHPFRPDHWPIWSVVWEGYLEAPETGDYLLNLHVNNGGWLEMKDAAGGLRTVISCPGGSGFEGDCPATVNLDAGRHYIRISYYNNAPSAANAIFSWQRPGESGVSVVPTEALWTQAAPPANTAPTVRLACPAKVFVHDGAEITGSFADPDAGQTWTATFDGFNQAGPVPLALNADHTFSLVVRAPTLGAGTFNAAIVVTDSAGAAARATCTIVAVPKRVMFYIHGTTGFFRQTEAANDFPSLFSRLFASYELRFYEYYEDRSNQAADRSCLPGRQRPIPPIDASAGMPLDPLDPDPAPGICDSNDDIELNAVRLDADIAKLGEEFDKVTLLSNSGGTRIVRAYLAYAKAANKSSLGLVDLVVTMEGAQQGSYITVVYDGLDAAVDGNPDLSKVRDSLLDIVRAKVGHDPTRPVFEDMRPRAPITRYTNTTVPVPDGPHYVNVNGDMRIHVVQSFFLIPLETEIYPVGDVVFLPGEDDPRALPERGGGRFLPSVAGRGASSTEWELTRDYDVNIDPTTPGLIAFKLQIDAILGGPEIHFNLGQKFDRICVRDRGVIRRLDAVIFDQIAALDTGLPPAPGRLGLGHQTQVSCP